jgi:hypothetical protein
LGGLEVKGKVTSPRLRADFNGVFGDLLCLSHGDSARDETNAHVPLSAGMDAIAFDEDTDEQGRPDNLIASGVVEPTPQWLQCSGSRWVLRIDAHVVRHESDLVEGDGA